MYIYAYLTKKTDLDNINNSMFHGCLSQSIGSDHLRPVQHVNIFIQFKKKKIIIFNHDTF